MLLETTVTMVSFVFLDYTQFLTNSSALEGAVFGVPWDSFWVYAADDNLPGLFAAIEAIREAGGTVLNGTELPNYKTLVPSDGWDWCVVPSIRLVHTFILTYTQGLGYDTRLP